jgi:hypothetical protein
LFINDVLEDSKEGGLRAEELDPLFHEFTLIAAGGNADWV